MAHLIRSSQANDAPPLIIFTHIPKTAGTSFVDTVIAPNVGAEALIPCGGFRSSVAAIGRRPQVITGHTPHGLHYFNAFLGRRTTYITFFRNPLERAVSYYHFVRESQFCLYKHPLYDYANSVSLTEFYRNRLFQNQQTRYIAGAAADRLYNVSSSKALEKAILRRAMNNLLQWYCCFGLQERFNESILLFQRTLDWRHRVSVGPQKATQRRPAVMDLDEETLQTLRHAHRLDAAFYDFAVQRFDTLLGESDKEQKTIRLPVV